jgi:hypothetical protein
MGNTLPLPSLRYGANAEVAATAGAGRSRKRKTARRNGRAAAAHHVVPADVPEESAGDGEEDRITATWPGCRVEPVGGDDGGAVRVKIVMKKTEAEELVARLLQRDAAGRKARTEELNTELDGGGGAVTMSPCRESWRPQLPSIPEN